MQGQASDMEIAAEHMQYIKQKTISYFRNAKQAKKPETIRNDCDRDTYMNAQKSKRLWHD